MAMRDCGWIQLYAADNQEAVDLHVQAFKIAEQLATPVMVCMDGFVLTHAFEPLEIPSQEDVDAFLPPFAPRAVLDPDEPMTIGAMVGPEAFTEVRYLQHAKQIHALDVIPQVADEFRARFGRASGGLLETYRADDATMLVLALGSVNGTLAEVVDELRDRGVAVGAIALKSFRPFPLAALRAAVETAQRVVVLERALAVGVGGIVSANVRTALAGLPVHAHTVIAGLGGRAVTRRSLRRLLALAVADELGELEFLDLRLDVVQRELARSGIGSSPATGAGSRPGPHAESILRELGVIAGGPV
jgi:pyruvate ferredoxin oxidoreductase alpha subunit